MLHLQQVIQVGDIARALFVALLGLGGGLAVGSGLVSLLIILDLIPRLAQLGNAYRHSVWFETAVIAGALYWTFADFMDWSLHWQLPVALPVAGLFDGLFVGMLAAALTEVMNVLPILAKRIGLARHITALVLAMVLGKTAGSLFDWLYYQW
ncbi:stage V sporulation protein AB [Paenibacillus sp. MMS18-CY102]|uniref:stage V sporulation protein AB n=1 Tax=Paenibacillus sp. MMS18-CY102 TaxID=2682849 RepID=UPI001365BF51|nr:stage V sporulation protein AB [Paenibacillus sp. MMS18-CY102]MWC28406.1 stage V sporulation protein AB [Paenibacillus sp. MMS18-CY102]